MPPLRALRPLLPSLPQRSHPTTQVRLASTTARHGPTDDRTPVNDPTPPAQVPNISKTNELPTSSRGARDADLVEMKEPEKARTMQAPNRAGVWSRSQEPRERAMSGPRFEQTMMEYQVREVGEGCGEGKLCCRE